MLSHTRAAGDWGDTDIPEVLTNTAHLRGNAVKESTWSKCIDIPKRQNLMKYINPLMQDSDRYREPIGAFCVVLIARDQISPSQSEFSHAQANPVYGALGSGIRYCSVMPPHKIFCPDQWCNFFRNIAWGAPKLFIFIIKKHSFQDQSIQKWIKLIFEKTSLALTYGARQPGETLAVQV